MINRDNINKNIYSEVFREILTKPPPTTATFFAGCCSAATALSSAILKWPRSIGRLGTRNMAAASNAYFQETSSKQIAIVGGGLVTSFIII